jgi:hypothetical protein
VALQGTLETFSVPEVLRLLSGTKKTGLLALDGDRGSGRVWLADGQIVGARSDHEPDGLPEAVLFDLLRYEDGSFVFETGTEYDGEDPGAADVETALESAERLLEEWREIESVVPSLRVWVSMVPTISEPSISVTSEQWSALAIVGRGTSGHRLGDELGLGELDASRRIRDLVEAGLVEVDDTPVERDLEPISSEAVSEDRTEDSYDRHDGDLDDASSDRSPDPWTPGPDLAEGLAGFVARSSAEERGDRTSSWAVDEEVVHVETAAVEAIHLDVSHEDTIDVTDQVPVDDAVEDDHDDVDQEFDDGFEEDEPQEVAELDAEPTSEDEDAAPEPAAEDETQDEFLSQLANLSPKAAAAIEATASADETASSTPKLPSGDGDEEINRNLLLKFLSSAKP